MLPTLTKCTLTHSYMYTHTHTHTVQHKTRAFVSTTKGTQHLAGEIRSASDLDFYVDGVSSLNILLFFSCELISVY
jgi:hypothetical protein